MTRCLQDTSGKLCNNLREIVTACISLVQDQPRPNFGKKRGDGHGVPLLAMELATDSY